MIFTDATVERVAELRRYQIPESHLQSLVQGHHDPRLGLTPIAAAWRADTSSHVLILSGGVGTGKTHAAAWLLAEGPRNPTHSDGSRRYVLPGRLRHLNELDFRDASIVVLDAVEDGFRPSFEQWGLAEIPPALRELLLQRITLQLDTILITYLSREDFAAQIGAAALEGATWHSCEGPSLRQTGLPYQLSPIMRERKGLVS